MKKIISVLLTVCMLSALCSAYAFAASDDLPCSPPYSGETEGAQYKRFFEEGAVVNAAGLENFIKVNTYIPGQFTDVPSTEWYAGSVQTAYELGLVKGSSDITFNPSGKITAAEVITLACRLNSIYNGGTGEFIQDIPWYQVYVDYAIANGILTPGKFSDYDTPVTRADFALIISKALPPEALPAINSITNIVDVPVYKSYAAAVYQLYNAGILTGKDEYGTFDPESSIVRSEVAAIITRMAIKSERKLFSVVSYTGTGDDAFLESLNYHKEAMVSLSGGFTELSTAYMYLENNSNVSAASHAEAGRAAIAEGDTYLQKAIDACGDYPELTLYKSYLQQIREYLRPLVSTKKVTADNMASYLAGVEKIDYINYISVLNLFKQEAQRLLDEISQRR